MLEQPSSFESSIGTATIRQASMLDDSWLRHLSRIFSNQIGFIPDKAREHRISLGHVEIITINNQPGGFLIHSLGIRKPAHLAQIALSEDAWRFGIAEFAINDLLQRQADAIHPGLTANVRSDLHLNRTALHMGAEILSVGNPTTCRALPITKYQWDLKKTTR